MNQNLGSTHDRTFPLSRKSCAFGDLGFAFACLFIFVLF